MPSKRNIASFLMLIFLFCTNNFSDAAIYENEDITRDTLWRSSDIHVVTKIITINPGVTLTIAPGTIVKFNSDCRLYVNQGALMAEGNESNPIVFTSYRDDHFGGDTNEDGPGNGYPGDWQAIHFFKAVSTQSKLAYCTIRYAGQGNLGAVYLDHSEVPVLFNDIGDSSSYGIYSSSTSLLIQGNYIHNCQLYGVYHLNAIQARIDENIITENAYGIFVQNATPEIENNQITQNKEWGIYFSRADNAPVIKENKVTHNYQSVCIPASAVPHIDDGNTLAPNTLDGIWIRGNERTADLHFQLLNAGQQHEINTYFIYNTLTIQAESTLRIDPGVIVKFSSDAGLTIHGALLAIGSSQLPVVFTSYADDRFGGDLNQDAYHSSPENGDWRSIYFSNNAMESASVIDHAIICYGGSANQGMVYGYQTNLEIKNSLISNSSTNGIRAYRSNFQFVNNEVFGNSGNGISLEYNGAHTIIQSRIFTNFGDGIVSTSHVSLSLTACEIFANEGYGVRNSSGESISARKNWWGAVNGPGGFADGDGDEISENVDFTDFLVQGTQFSYFNAGPNMSQGTIPGPIVRQGITSTAWGNDARKSMLYDLDRVILDYESIDPDLRYEIFLNCYNADDTSGIGGNIQRLVDHNDYQIHGNVNIASNTPRQYHVYLPHQTYDQGQLKLQFIRENGYRAVISQVWIIERAQTNDIEPPVSEISQLIDKQYLSGNAIEITGTSTDNNSGILGVEIGINVGTKLSWYPVTQLQSNGQWSYIWTLPSDGTYTLYARARDMTGNLETAGSSISVIVNNRLPQSTSALSVYDVSDDAGGQMVLSWQLSSDDGQNANDILCYEIERSMTENGPFSNVGSVNAGMNTYTDLTTNDGQSYYYRIKTIDFSKNHSFSTVYGPVISINNTLPDNTPPENITELNANAGNGFIYVSWIKSINTALDLVDQLLDISTDEGITWQNPIHMGKETDTWFIDNLNNETHYRIRIRTKDSSGNISEGLSTASLTPTGTAVTTISGEIDRDTIWFAGVFYVNNNLTINTGVTLTIQPGVVVKFGTNKNLTVYGTLIAKGTGDAPIVFTSYADDFFEGDSNGDGESIGKKGDWTKLLFNNADTSILSHVIIRYGGSNGSLHLYQSDITIENCEISNSASHGIYCYSSSPKITDNTITHNDKHGIFLQYATPEIHGNHITNNKEYGIYFNDASACTQITHNTIINNHVPVRLPFSSLPDKNANNELAPNTINKIEFMGNTLTRNLLLDPTSINVYCQVEGNATIAAGVKLTVLPGIIWKIGNHLRLYVHGAFYAKGTDTHPIVFTSYRDDTFGGDSNDDGHSTGHPGDWQDIYFSDSVIDFLTRLEHVIIQYAGYSNTGAVQMISADIALISSDIRNNSSYGVYIQNASPYIQGNTIHNCESHGIYSYCYYQSCNPQFIGNELSNNENGIFVNSALAVIDNNTITHNRDWGIYFQQAIDAPVITKNTITDNKQGILIPASALPSADDENILMPNQYDGIWIRGNERSTDLHLSCLNDGQDHEIHTYLIYDTLTVSKDTTLNIDPGVILKFYENAGLQINGALIASGEPDNPIVFTSYKDDRYGGDLNHDGFQSGPMNGDWRGIFLSSQANADACTLNHVILRFAGRANNGSIYAYASGFHMQNSIIANSSTNGIRGYQSNCTIVNSELFGNTQDAIHLESRGTYQISHCKIFANYDDGIHTTNSVSINISNCEIFGNLKYGIQNSSVNTIYAENNWWGAIDGPGGNGAGTGNPISENVRYEPFLTEGTSFNYFNAGDNTSSGTIAGPTVMKGTASKEWGVDPVKSTLYDLDHVILSYPSIDTASRFEIFLTYYNADHTDSIGGNIQRLLDARDVEIHRKLNVSGNSPGLYHFYLPSASHASGNLLLKFVKDNGYRAVISQVWIIARTNTADIQSPVSVIDLPQAGQHLSSDTIEIRGRSTDDGGNIQHVEVGVAQGEDMLWYPVTQLQSQGRWIYQWQLSGDGPIVMYARARDQAGNLEIPETGISVVVNTTPPEPVSHISAFDTPEDNGSTISLLWQLSSDDGTGANDVSQYNILRTSNLNDPFTHIQTVAAGINYYTDSGIDNEQAYYYKIQTQDLAGNISLSNIYGPVIAIDNQMPDNIPPEDISQLNAIAGNQFVYVSWTNSLNSALDLINQILDISLDDGNSWQNSIQLGKEANNYLLENLINETSYRIRIRTKDSSGNISDGIISASVTPSNTAVTTVSGTIHSDTTWAAGIYYVNKNLTVSANICLTIKPGVVIKMAPNRNLFIQGTLHAVGTSEKPIVFTAYADDRFGGDSNGDGDSTGEKGAWGKLHFSNTTSSILEYVNIHYAGSDGSIYIYQSDILIKSCEIKHGASHGIYIYSASPQIINNTIANNDGSGMFLQYATPVIDSNIITENANYGILFNNVTDSPVLTRNVITNNNIPIRVPFSALPGKEAGNTLYPNTKNHIEFIGNTLNRNLELASSPIHTYYQVSGNVTIPAGVMLRLNPGMVWKFARNARLDIQGAFYVVGNETNKIVFTSYQDDEFGGDTDGNGFSRGKAGDWQHISFSDSVIDFLTRLEHVIIRYAGYGGYGAVFMNDASVDMAFAEINHSSSYGVCLYNCASPLINHSQIVNCQDHGIFLYQYYSKGTAQIIENIISNNLNGIYVDGATPAIEKNTITDNQEWGIHFYQAVDTSVIKENTITGNKQSALLPASIVPGSDDGNILSPNTINGLWILGNERSTDLHLKLLFAGQDHEINTYQIQDMMIISENATLTIDPGVIVKFYSGAGLDIRGKMFASGTASHPIIFTSYKDDLYGGDFNRDHYHTIPLNGDWQGISFIRNSDESIIDHAVIRFGGNAQSGNIYVYESDLVINNTTISNSGYNGIRGFRANLNIFNTDIFGNTQDGIHLDASGNHTIIDSRLFANFGDGIETKNSVTASLTGCEIFANQEYGIRNLSNQIISARDNWWGAQNGPILMGEGFGDEISDQVLIDPYRMDGTEYYCFNAGLNHHYGYGILQPVLTGKASTEWGETNTHSILFRLDNQPITAEYIGLASDAAYQMFVTYLNMDTQNSIQYVSDIHDHMIQQPMGLPEQYPVQYDYAVPSSSIENGNLKLFFNRTSGLRTVLSGLILMKHCVSDHVPPEIHITSPRNGDILSGKQMVISGLATDADSVIQKVSVGIQQDEGTTQWHGVSSIGSTGIWQYSWDSPESGNYQIHARTTDITGNIGIAPETVLIHIDTSVPAAPENILAQNLSDAYGIIISWDMVLDADLVRYDVYRSDNKFDYVLIAQIGSHAHHCIDNTVSNGMTYYYYVSAVDHAGNKTTSAITDPIESTIVPDTTAPDDITDLKATVTQIPGMAPAFFLSWSPSPNTESDLSGLLLYVSTDGIMFGNNPPDFNNTMPYSLDRHASSYHISNLEENMTYYFKMTTYDEVPNESNGISISSSTMNVQNSYITLSGKLSHNTTIGSGLYYISSHLTIPSDVQLKIQAGAIIKLARNTRIIVSGCLIAHGTETNPIIFTAFTDDTHGGDTNNDGDSTGTKGYWDKIFFVNAEPSHLEYVRVLYGTTNIYIDQSEVTLMNGESSNASSIGIYTYHASSQITHNVISNNTNAGIHHYGNSAPFDSHNLISGNDTGIHVQYASPMINSNTITNNTNYGIFFDDNADTKTITYNTIINNKVSLRIPVSAFPDDTNTLWPNTTKQIELLGNSLHHDIVFRIWGKGTPNEVNTYIVYNQIYVPVYTFLHIEPGVIVKFASNAQIYVDGALIANANVSNKIVFTSIKDDNHGGDTNEDAWQSIPVNGDWEGLTFQDSYFENESHLNHVIMRYSQFLNIYSADITIENSELSNQSNNAIQIYNSSPTIIGNKIWGNTQDGIFINGNSYPQISFNSISTNLSDGIEILHNSDPILSNNRIFMNRNYGVNNQTSNILDATYCWWGDTDASGPYQETSNPEGTGNAVNNNVNYEYFQTTVATSFSYINFREDLPLHQGSISAPELIQGALSNEWDTAQKRPDRTIAWDKNHVTIHYTGLERSTSYHLRVSYYNGDPGNSFQSLTNGNDNRIHASMVMPWRNPVQFEFSIPSSFYASGDLQLKFVHDNPDTSIRAAVPEIFLMQSIKELTPPHLERIEYNDRDGSQSLTLGDEYYFHFSEEMDISLLRNNTTDANERLAVYGDFIYGTVNTSRWTADNKTVVITLTEGFSITGNELIKPEQLTDLFGNAAVGSTNLNTTDSIAPIFTALTWQDIDNNEILSEGDRYIFQFNETMDVSVIQDNTQDANIHLRPHGGMTYGHRNHLIWSSNAQTLTLTVTQSFTIVGDELVIPGNFVCDIAGNTVQGKHYLTGKDLIQPEILAVQFDDTDGSGTVSIGDWYIFTFSEPMNQSSLSNNSSEANDNLSPSGKTYGDVNIIHWDSHFKQCNVQITRGFNIDGNETVIPSKILADKAGNVISNTAMLNLNDTVMPEMVQIQGNYISPVGAVDNYRLSIQFNTSMNPDIKPSIHMDSTGEHHPEPGNDGTWLTTLYPNDTYLTPDMQFINTMDGKIEITQIADCEDMAGNIMLPLTNIYSFILDATPPQSPTPTIHSLTCDGATIAWPNYCASDDLAGFQIFLQKDTPFYTIVDHAPLDWLERNERTYELSALELNRHYFITVIAVDKTGNRILDVNPLELMIETTVPKPVQIEISPAKDGDAASISWTNYDGDTICGFDSYQLFYEETAFHSLDGLQPKKIFPKNLKQFTVKDLNRKKHYYFAVAACNVFEACTQEVFTQEWSDPYAGHITNDIVLGSGDEKEIAIYASLVVTNGAQMTITPGTHVYFANDTGITVQSGALIAQGTAIDPIVFTSENEKTSAANPGDWEGIRIIDNAGNSNLSHVYIQYGQGLQLNNSSPIINAFSCLNNTLGIGLENKSMITTNEAYIVNNNTGIQMDDSSMMSIRQSIIRDNGNKNAAVTGTTALDAIDNFWASTDATIIESQLSGIVSYAPFLEDEPLLTPAIAPVNRQTTVGSRAIDLQFACRGAKEMRMSEDSAFKSEFFQPFHKNHTFSLSENGGNKTIFVQFKSGTGALSDKLSLNLTYITEGPVITHFNLSESQKISRPFTVNASASAVFGMDTIAFFLDDHLIKRTMGINFSYDWDVRYLDDGIHRVKLLATDLAGNIVKEEINVMLQISPPIQPNILAPANDLLVHTDAITVSGMAEPGMKIQITRNGYMAGAVTASSDGSFALSDVTLVEGSNILIVSALDDTGISMSPSVNIILDTDTPDAPLLLEPEIHAGLGIALRFKYAETGERPVAFHIYRHDAFFTDSDMATLLKENCIDLAYIDAPPGDGRYFYAIEGIDKAGNLSSLSNIVEIDYDQTAPSFEISSDKMPPFGQGTVDIILTVSEKLFQKPGLTISPAGMSSPESVQLTKVDDYHYQGIYEITELTKSGTAIIVVSGKDMAGNMYKGQPSGPDFVIDTDGPVAAITIEADPPVKITESIDIALALTFNEKIKPGMMPMLTFNPPEGNAVHVALSGSDTIWNGILQLRTDMGKGNAIFEISAMDIHGNLGKEIHRGQILEIFNTSLPDPPDSPEHLRAIPKSGGHIHLSWDISEKAETYQVFQSPGDCSISPTHMIASNITVTEYLDSPETDGTYCYGVRAERRGAQSSYSNIVSTASDRMPPDPPNNVIIVMGQTGIILSWDMPAEAVAHYHIYRNGVNICTIEGHQTQWIDHPPTGGDYEYIVAAVDPVKNENPSPAVDFSMAVGAVSQVVVEMAHEQVPHIHWQNNDNKVVGYNIYRGGKKLNTKVLEKNEFVDTFYSGTSMLQYDIRAVNVQEKESPARVVNIYPVQLGLQTNPDENQHSRPLISNVFNRYQLSIKNNDTILMMPVYQIQLDMHSDGMPIFTWKKTLDMLLPENSAYSKTIIQPSGSEIHDRLLTIKTIQMDQSGNQVIYTRAFELTDIERPGQALEISTKAIPLSGGYANIMLCMINHGFADMDVVVSKNNGADPGDIYVAIKNEAGVVISKTRFNGFPSGTRVTNDGTAYVRIAPHSKKWIETRIMVPESLEKGDILTFEGVIEKTYYHMEDQPAIKSGLITGHFQSGITRSEYFGTASTQKDVYTNNEPIIISGQAIDRQANVPQPETDLKVGFYSRGFKWFENVQTDESGNYTYIYQPPMGLSGSFMIWAAHPDVFDTIDQDQFDLFRLYCTPATGDIRMSKADTMDFAVELYNPGEHTLTDFTFDFRSYIIDNEGHDIEEQRLDGNVHYDNFILGPGEKRSVNLSLHAAIDAPANAGVAYTFISSQGASVVFKGAVSLLPAEPIISVVYPSAGFVDLSIDRGKMKTISVTIKNNGLEDLRDVEMILPQKINWMTTNLPNNETKQITIADLHVGDTFTFDVIFMPPEDTFFGYHEDKIVIKGSNADQTFDIRLFAMITSNLNGSSLFKVTNILGQKVENARIFLRNTAIQKDFEPVRTNDKGEAHITDLQEGKWSWKVVASGHTSKAGVVNIGADQEQLVEIMLSRSLVTINFTVAPVPFTDRYEVKIEQTFETHVPAGVLVLDPPKKDFVNVRPDFQADFIVKVKNYGLIKIHDLNIDTAQTSWGLLEPLISYVPELGAMEEMDVPYRLVYYGDDLSRKRFDTGNYADCVTGGFAELAEGLLGLNSAFRGRTFCYGGAGLGVANGLIVGITLYNAVGMITSPVSFIGNAISCFAQQFVQAGSDGGGIGPSTRPGQRLTGDFPCFTPDTLIYMADGSQKEIKNIQVGEWVLAYNGKRDQVKKMYTKESDHIREIWYMNDKGLVKRIQSTDDHLFWVNNQDWMPARKIMADAVLMSSDGNHWKVIKNERFPGKYLVYNFDVMHYRSYFANGVLVHERCGVLNDIVFVMP